MSDSDMSEEVGLYGSDMSEEGSDVEMAEEHQTSRKLLDLDASNHDDGHMGHGKNAEGQEKSQKRYFEKRRNVSSQKRLELDASNAGRIKTEVKIAIKKQLQRLQRVENITYLFAMKMERMERKIHPFVAARGSLRDALYKSYQMKKALMLSSLKRNRGRITKACKEGALISSAYQSPSVEHVEQPTPSKMPVSVGATHSMRSMQKEKLHSIRLLSSPDADRIRTACKGKKTFLISVIMSSPPLWGRHTGSAPSVQFCCKRLI